MSDNKFIEGLYYNKPHEKAPDFVKGGLGIQKARFIEWLNKQEGDTVRIDLKESREGKFYAEVNDWKPDNQTSTPTVGGEPDLPF